jgi:Rrf2 family protein
VTARRGLRGGFRLSRDPNQITILDVLNVVQPVQRIGCCPLGIEGHKELCPLHRRLDEAAEHIEKSLGHTTIADLLNDPRSRPLCGAAELGQRAADVVLNRVPVAGRN